MVFAALLYHCLISMGNVHSHHHTQADNSEQTHNIYASVSATSLLYHVASSEPSVGASNTASPSSSKSLFDYFWGVANRIENLFGFEAFKRLSIGSYILINLRGIDIIFPFHYFW